MKRRVAVFANGWGMEYLRKVVTGIYGVARDADTDIFVFVNFSNFFGNEQTNNSESNIFRLPELRDFDGVIVMANSFNRPEEVEYVYHKVVEAGIPAISIEYDYEGIRTISTDNYHGMHELAKHVVQEHGARQIVFVGGPREHAESNIRLQAVLDVVKENGLSLPAENIMYGDWAKDLPKKFVGEWIDQHKCLPDIFICANDVMAMGICDLLKERGYKIPEDVMVTGYDCIMTGQEYSPSIASVDHEWRSMGEKAIQILLDDMEGSKDESSFVMRTEFIPGGSCGCESCAVKIKEGRERYSHRADSLAWDAHFRHLYLAIRKAENADGLNYSLNSLFQNECWMEGGNFMLCLDREFFNIE
ncbi:MAG: LacI family transcriptional regulator, partial [Acetatifactor sp.]|nr:LacI family transcriptional regulator [Acetatifactor sp.]